MPSEPLPSASGAAPVRHSHCASCGAAFTAGAGWPRQCPACGTWAYRNPLPVAVALVPVRDAEGEALVVIRRAIRPHVGALALPGGFIDFGESWQQAVVRELAEETGIPAAAHEVALADALTDEEGGYLLLFGLLPARAADTLPPSAPTDETDGYELLRAPADLGFPLHTEAVRRHFAGGYASSGAGAASPRTRIR